LQKFNCSIDASHHDHQRTEKHSRKHDHPSFPISRVLRLDNSRFLDNTPVVRSVGDETEDKVCAEDDEDDNCRELEDDTGDHCAEVSEALIV
jgi:hypothetical protein